MQAPHVWSDYNWCTRHASLYSRVAGVDRQPVQLSDVAQMCTVAPPSSSDEMKRNNFRQKSNMANGRRLEFLRSSHCVITVTQTDTPNYAENSNLTRFKIHSNCNFLTKLSGTPYSSELQ